MFNWVCGIILFVRFENAGGENLWWNVFLRSRVSGAGFRVSGVGASGVGLRECILNVF